MKIKAILGICASVIVAGITYLYIDMEKDEKERFKKEAQEEEEYINTPITLLKLITQNNYRLPIDNRLPGGNRKTITILIVDTGEFDVESLYEILENNEELKVINDTETITLYKGFTHVSNIKRIYNNYIYNSDESRIGNYNDKWWVYEPDFKRLEKNGIKTNGNSIQLFRVTLTKKSEEE